MQGLDCPGRGQVGPDIQKSVYTKIDRKVGRERDTVPESVGTPKPTTPSPHGVVGRADGLRVTT